MIGDQGTPAWRRLLETIVSARCELDRMEFEAVQTVREAGATWEEIGDALGMTRQAARQRFGEVRRRRR